MFEQLEHRIVLAGDLAAAAMPEMVVTNDMLDQDLVPAEICCDASLQDVCCHGLDTGTAAE